MYKTAMSLFNATNIFKHTKYVAITAPTNLLKLLVWTVYCTDFVWISYFAVDLVLVRKQVKVLL